MKFLPVCVLMLLSGVYASTLRASEGRVLTTERFHITITEHCEEGEVGCSDVSYLGVNKLTGKSILLKGKNQMVMCKDGITPCHSAYYDFKNSIYRYRVYPDGTLVIEKRGKQVLSEKGVWQ
jgi:hypothetical protein